jgi:hypothetical protein
MTKLTTKNTNTYTDDNTVRELAQLEVLRKQAASIEARLAPRLARGTGDVTTQANAALVAAGVALPTVPLHARIEAHLRVKPHTILDLARELREPVGKISNALRPLKRHLYNVGTAEMPVWFWILGDETPTDQLNAAVATLVAYRPMTFAELQAATGARYGRVSGAMVALRRDPKSRVVDLNGGAGGKARWWILPAGIEIARLKSH